MFQKFSKPSHHRHSEKVSPSAPHHHSHHSSHPRLHPPEVGKVDHHSIELHWVKQPDDSTGDERLKYALEQEEKKTHHYLTAYIGYSDYYKVEGLDPLQSYKYRLKTISKEGEILVSHTITVCTTDSQHSSPVKLNPPEVGKVDHQSIELHWIKQPDSSTGDERLKYVLEQEEKKTELYFTAYIGYSDYYKVEGLDPLQSYTYRLKTVSKDDEVSVSHTITVCTTDEPYNGDHLHRATSQGDLEAIERIMTTGEVSVDVTDKLGYTPLMNAAQKGHSEVVDALLEASANVHAVNSSGKNSLMLACYAGHEDVVRRLRGAGASWRCSDRGGSTPIHWAMDGKNINLIRWMLQDGVSVDVKDATSGWTPLIRCAAITGDPYVAELLLKAGADVNATDTDGKSALMIAALNGHLLMVEKLVEYGADIELQSGHGKTALEMAQSFDRRLVVMFFEKIMNEKDAEGQRRSD